MEEIRQHYIGVQQLPAIPRDLLISAAEYRFDNGVEEWVISRVTGGAVVTKGDTKYEFSCKKIDKLVRPEQKQKF